MKWIFCQTERGATWHLRAWDSQPFAACAPYTERFVLSARDTEPTIEYRTTWSIKICRTCLNFERETAAMAAELETR